VTEVYRLVNGKVIVGPLGTVLHDGKTGRWYDVIAVYSGRMTELCEATNVGWRGSSAESCALYGGKNRQA